MRIDQLLVQRGLAPSRSAAQRLIERGAVRWRTGEAWAVVRKAGDDLPDHCALEVTDDAEIRWASRAGLKLDGALERLRLNINGWRCLDLGQSTGGFTDVLLARGAMQVVGVDVGHGQIHPRLASDSRVRVIENLDVRDWADSELNAPHCWDSYDLVVGDLSFISQIHALNTVLEALAPTGHVLMLVKPQFELQPSDIGKGGLVRSDALYGQVEQAMRKAYDDHMLEVKDYFESLVSGGDGNREFFIHATRGYERLAETLKWRD